jgi:hypothetical protein
VFKKCPYLLNFVTKLTWWLVFCKLLTCFLSVYLECFVRLLLIISYCYYGHSFLFSVSLFCVIIVAPFLFFDSRRHSLYTGYVTDQTTEESCFNFRDEYQILLLPQPPDLLGVSRRILFLGHRGLFPAANLPDNKTDHSPHILLRLRMTGAILPLLHIHSWRPKG